jgi:hypothetical protein
VCVTSGIDFCFEGAPAFLACYCGEAGNAGTRSPALLAGGFFWFFCVSALTAWLVCLVSGNREWGPATGTRITSWRSVSGIAMEGRNADYRHSQ